MGGGCQMVHKTACKNRQNAYNKGMEASQLKQLLQWEQEMKDANYQAGELQDFSYFLTNDFIKDSEGKQIALVLIYEKIHELKELASATLNVIILRRKEWDR